MMSKCWLAASVRKIRFQSAIAWSCQKIAASVWSGVRVMLVSEPTSLISLKSSAYSALVSAFGPSVRSISTFGTMNGRTFPTHGAGSFSKFGGVGRQIPGRWRVKRGRRPEASVIHPCLKHCRGCRLTDSDPRSLRSRGIVGEARYVRVVERLQCSQLPWEDTHEHAERRCRRGRFLRVRWI